MQIYLKKPIPQTKERQLHAKHLTLCHTDTALSSPSFPHFSALVYSSFPADVGSPSPRGIKWPHIGCLSDQYRIIPHTYWDCCRKSYPLFRVLRHRTPSSPIYLSEVTSKPFIPSRAFLLFSGGKIVLLVKKKAPSRSDILLSTHVVLKTRYVNPNIHVRRY